MLIDKILGQKIEKAIQNIVNLVLLEARKHTYHNNNKNKTILRKKLGT